MSEQSSTAPGKAFYVISIIALLWNLAGVAAYLGQVTMSPETLAAMGSAERALYENVPAWATAAFAIAVHGGAIGCILLLLRNAGALVFFVLSTAGVIVQMGHAFLMTEALAVLGPTAAVMPGLIFVAGLLLIWFTLSSKSKGWIR